MGRILHPLFALLASVTRQDLARQVAYLKEENRILSRVRGCIIPGVLASGHPPLLDLAVDGSSGFRLVMPTGSQFLDAR